VIANRNQIDALNNATVITLGHYENT